MTKRKKPKGASTPLGDAELKRRTDEYYAKVEAVMRNPFAEAALMSTTAEGKKHAIVRNFFRAEMADDPRVREALDDWRKRSGVADAIEKLRPLSQKVAGELGLENLWTSRFNLTEDACERITKKPEGPFTELLLKFQGAIDDFADGLDSMTKFNSEAIGVIREIGFPWPWTLSALADLHRATAIQLASGVPTLWNYSVTILAPTTSLHFETETRESVKHAVARLTKMYIKALLQLNAPIARAKPGQPPKRGGEYLRDYVHWLYQNRFMKKSKKSLAKDFHRKRITLDGTHPSTLEDCGCRGAVTYGIREATRLLDLSAYSLTPGEGKTRKTID